MEYLIFSDSHGNIELMEEIIRKNKSDIIIHLGDYTSDIDSLKNIFFNRAICGVAGNNDFFSDYPNQIIIPDQNNKILCNHGHKLGVKSSIDTLIYTAKKATCNIALFGHTHIAFSEYKNNILLINPGSITYSRTYATLSINNNTINYKIHNLDFI